MLTNRAEFTYDYSPLLNVPYADYLRAKRRFNQERQFEGSIRYGIDSAARSIIENNKEVLGSNISVVEENLKEGFCIVEERLIDVRAAIEAGSKEIVSSLNWGFGELLASFGHLQDSVDDLKRMIGSPAQTAAYEQYRLALENIRRRLLPEALENLQWAIEGHAGSTGVKTEFRFHFHVGVIRLGDTATEDPSVVDPAMAETAFITAARYARHDYPAESGLALISAGRAAYVQGRCDQSLVHVSDGLELLPKRYRGQRKDAYYLLAKAASVVGDLQLAERALVEAIKIDHDVAWRMLAEQDFLRHPHLVEGVRRKATEFYAEQFSSLLDDFDRYTNRLLSFSYGATRLSDLVSDAPQELSNLRKSVTSIAAIGEIAAYVQAMTVLRSIQPSLDRLFDRYKRSLQEVHSATPRPDPLFGGMMATIAAILVAGLALWMIWSTPTILVEPSSSTFGGWLLGGVNVLMFLVKLSSIVWGPGLGVLAFHLVKSVFDKRREARVRDLDHSFSELSRIAAPVFFKHDLSSPKSKPLRLT